MSKHIITVLLFVAAVALYAVGLALPASALVGLGILVEGAFWIRLLRRPSVKSNT